MTRDQAVYLHVCTALTAVTGLVFAIMKYGLTTDDPFAVVNHPMQPAMLSSHIIAAPFLVFALGLIFSDHIWPRFRQQAAPKRKSGVSSMAMLVPMTLSGYLLQVSTGDATRRVMAIAHWTTSGIFVVAYVVHLFIAPQRAAGRPDN